MMTNDSRNYKGDRQRLIGELILYPWSGVRPFTISNIFYSKTAWPIKAKFYVEHPGIVGTNVCSRHLGHMTKMAATPIYGRNTQKSSPEQVNRFPRKLVCSIGDSELIVYPWSGVRPFTISNIFYSKTAWPIKATFYVEPPGIVGTIVCSRHLGHMTKN